VLPKTIPLDYTHEAITVLQKEKEPLLSAERSALDVEQRAVQILTSIVINPVVSLDRQTPSHA
jgi:hypothetical protein